MAIDLGPRPASRLSEDEKELKATIQYAIDGIPGAIARSPRGVPLEGLMVAIPLRDLRQILALAMEQLLEKETTP